MPAAHQIQGKTFGRLTVTNVAHGSGPRAWLCLCKCGRSVVARAARLVSGRLRSCGCLVAERARETHTQHGLSSGALYSIWEGMKYRCKNPKHPSFRYYGGRGITVCDRWQSFDNFAADMGSRPNGMTLERIDNNGHYEPGNCKWATTSEQARNTRRVKLYTYAGKTMCMTDWIAEIRKHGC